MLQLGRHNPALKGQWPLAPLNAEAFHQRSASKRNSHRVAPAVQAAYIGKLHIALHSSYTELPLDGKPSLCHTPNISVAASDIVGYPGRAVRPLATAVQS